MKTLFELDTIDVSDIDHADNRFKISDDRNDSHLEQSIRAFGILCPPLLLQKARGFCVVSGFRRIEILREMAVDQVLARVIRSEDDLLCAKLSIVENAGERNLSVSEQIRAISVLAPFFSEPHDSPAFFQTACDVMMLPANKGYISKLLCVSTFEQAFLGLVAQERISLDVAVDLSGFDHQTQTCFYPFFSEFKMSVSKQKEFILMAREIAARERCSICEVLTDTSQVNQANRDITDSNARFNCIRNYLHERRYPDMTRIVRQHEALVSGLKIPDGMKLVVPEALEGRTYQIQIMFQSLNDLKKHREKIEQLCVQPGMKMILEGESGIA